MYKDKIVAEVRKVRAKLEKAIGNTPAEIHKYFIAQQETIEPSRIRRVPKRHKIKTAA